MGSRTRQRHAGVAVVERLEATELEAVAMQLLADVVDGDFLLERRGVALHAGQRADLTEQALDQMACKPRNGEASVCCCRNGLQPEPGGSRDRLEKGEMRVKRMAELIKGARSSATPAVRTHQWSFATGRREGS